MNFIRRSYVINFRFLKHFSTSKGSRDLLNIREIAGVNKFIQHREDSKLLIKNPSEYLTNLAQASNANNDSLIFSEDIKKMITLAETDKDILLLEKVLLKYSSQKNVMQYKPFFFGPQIMRLLYIKNKPYKALDLVKNPNLSQYFNHAVSVLLLLDLLYINEMYMSVIEMYEYLKKNADRKYGYAIKLYFFAACYKANTKEAFEKAKANWNLKVHDNKGPTLRIRLIFSMLLLKHNECPSDIVISSPSYPFLSLRENIKYMALAKANRFWDISKAIEDVLNSENRKHFLMSQEAISFIEKEVQGSAEDNMLRFHKAKQALMEKNLITQEPLDTFLFGDMSMGKNSASGLEEDHHSEETETSHHQKMHRSRDLYREDET